MRLSAQRAGATRVRSTGKLQLGQAAVAELFGALLDKALEAQELETGHAAFSL
jgi:hypothetical protein